MRIGIMGPQGSGKSTQAKLLADQIQACVVDTGSLIRERAKTNDEIGKKISDAIVKGELVENQIPADLLKDRLAHPDCQGGVVIDGYPRTFEQLKLYDPAYSKVIYLDISDQVAVERLTRRGREDDTPEGIMNRLSWFHQRTKDVLDHYQKLGILIKVDANQSEQQVFADIKKGLDING